MNTKISRRKALQLASVPALLPWTRANALSPTTSKVYPGVDGKLVYVPDTQGNTIIDASHAGYQGGGVGIPRVPVRETIWPVTGDNAEHLQSAIDRLSSLPLGPDGFRGTLLLKAGYYSLSKPLKIQASGIVLRGEGMEDSGTILFGIRTSNPEDTRGKTLVEIGGESGAIAQEHTRQAITDDYVPVGSRQFRVNSARRFSPGDKVIVRRHGNQDWIETVGMDGDTPRTHWDPFSVDWDRIIVDVQGDMITIDAPITCAIEQHWGGGDITKYEDDGRIENVGVENLRGIAEFDPMVRSTEYGNMDRPDFVAEEYYADEDQYRNFITFDNAKNCWVRHVTAMHFVYSMVGTQSGSKWITVQDCVSREPVSRVWGARRFTFGLRGQLALVQRCHSDEGRHSFVTGQPSGSGNVFLDCVATREFSSSEPHERWSTGTLYDNVQAPLTARFWKDISIGWAGANTVFWNCEGNFLIQKPPTAQNYAFGHIGLNAVIFNTRFQDPTLENGYMESIGQHVTPRSLYLTQLRERLGVEAVNQVATSTQLL
jgi:hypothetical protein